MVYRNIKLSEFQHDLSEFLYRKSNTKLKWGNLYFGLCFTSENQAKEIAFEFFKEYGTLLIDLVPNLQLTPPGHCSKCGAEMSNKNKPCEKCGNNGLVTIP